MAQHAPMALTGTDDTVFLPMTARSDRLGLAAVKLMADVPRKTPHEACRRSDLSSSCRRLTKGECVAVLGRADNPCADRCRECSGNEVPRAVGCDDPRSYRRGEPRRRARPGAAHRPPCRARGRWSRSTDTIVRFTSAVEGLVEVVPVSVRPPSSSKPTWCARSRPPLPRSSPARGWSRDNTSTRSERDPDPTSAKLDAAAMARGTLVVDNRATAAAKSGDLLLAIEDGALSATNRWPEIGEIVAGRAPDGWRRTR